MDQTQVREAIGRARAASDSVKLDRCSITRPSGSAPELDEEAGVLAAPGLTTVYAGPCRFRHTGATVDVQTREDSSSAPLRYELKVPAAEGPFKVGDVVTVLELGDPESVAAGLDTKSWQIGALPMGAWRVDQVLLIEEVVRRG